MLRKATQVLEEEHRVIQGMAASLAIVAEDIEKRKPVDGETLHNFVTFLDVFVQRCHHRKEETYLFAILEKKGVPTEGCPLAVLNNEHAKLRSLSSQFADSVELYTATQGQARVSLQKTIHALLELLPGHIWKEDYLLFPMADKLLSPEEQELLLTQFENVEARIGPNIHHDFERLAKRMEVTAQHP
jgi:hemerythrin-like domain-containing protein